MLAHKQIDLHNTIGKGRWQSREHQEFHIGCPTGARRHNLQTIALRTPIDQGKLRNPCKGHGPHQSIHNGQAQGPRNRQSANNHDIEQYGRGGGNGKMPRRIERPRQDRRKGNEQDIRKHHAAI